MYPAHNSNPMLGIGKSMKNIAWFLITLILLSCKKEKETNPDLSFLTRQQAPFGSTGVDVKLQKVAYNGRLLVEYTYDGNYLSQEKRYVTFAVPAHFGTGSFKRNEGVPESYDMVSADVSPEGGWVSPDFKPFYNLKFVAPTNDSVRNVIEEFFPDPYISLNDYFFDKDGYIKKHLVTRKGGQQITYHEVYKRDTGHNITERSGTLYDPSGSNAPVRFEYDDHPNPFFKLGLDWQGQMSVNAFSPNNIVREIRTAPGGSTFHVNYKYEYLPNGYPSKVTVQSDMPSAPGYTLEFFY
jgi:hypothetical protein